MSFERFAFRVAATGRKKRQTRMRCSLPQRFFFNNNNCRQLLLFDRKNRRVRPSSFADGQTEPKQCLRKRSNAECSTVLGSNILAYMLKKKNRTVCTLFEHASSHLGACARSRPVEKRKCVSRSAAGVDRAKSPTWIILVGDPLPRVNARIFHLYDNFTYYYLRLARLVCVCVCECTRYMCLCVYLYMYMILLRVKL